MATVATTYQRERELHGEIVELLADSVPDVEVLAVELLGPDRFCVYVDRPQGVDHALCGRVTDALRSYLDTYAVDVSSPGPERPLRTADHFRAAIGRSVAVRLGTPRDGRRNYRGCLIQAKDSRIVLELNDGETEIAYDEIGRANLIDDGRST